MIPAPQAFDLYPALLAHAKARADAIAVADGEREITYARFIADIERVTRRLHSFSLAPESRAVLLIASPYLHWLALIALWRLEILSVSVFNPGEPGLFELLRADVLITEQGNLQAQGGRTIPIGPDWLNADADALPPYIDPALVAGKPLRVLLSSGTTGVSKKIAFDKSVQGARILNTIDDYGFGPGKRFMSVVGVDTVAGCVYPIAMWAAGGSVAIYDPTVPFDVQLANTRPNIIFMAPAQLGHIVEQLPADFERDPSMMLLVGGGRLPQAVGEKARQRLAPVLWIVYGSTEAGTVTLAREPDYANPEIVGHVVQSAEVQIVDDAGRPVPHGTIGEVRMRGACSATGYLDDPATSATYFRGGWFHPGDTGTLSEDGLLSIVGRIGDIMNLGGVKVAPGAVEDALSSCSGVKEIAAFSMPDGTGNETLWLAVVTEDRNIKDILVTRYRELFPFRQSPNVARFEVIPRNAMGKVQRNMLRDAVRQRIDEVAAAGAAVAQIDNVPAIAFVSRTDATGSTINNNQEHTMQIVKINDKEYEFDKLSDEVKAQLANLQFVDAELQRLNLQRAALQTARAAYAKAIGDAVTR
jgi:acyl-CoA synthetase (AMP-forming)/AMP-acid ligase II